MKSKYFTKVEEKYVFNISLVFWHILIGLGGLAIVGGFFLFLWGIFPAVKHRVHKPVYPPAVKVTVKELKKELFPPRKKIKKRIYPMKGEKSAINKSGIKSGQKEYKVALDSLKTLIPPDKYAWDSRGHWYYPYGSQWSSYRKWIIDEEGINIYLEKAYKEANISSFLDKKKLLDAYISMVALFPETKRVSVLKALVTYTKDNVSQSVANVELLSKSVPKFSKRKVDYLEILAEFGKKNPRDGFSFIKYINKIIDKFNRKVRTDVLEVLISSYYKYYNNVARQIEATDLFLPMVAEFKPELQANALGNYYKIFEKKNKERTKKIKELDQKYKNNLAAVNARYAADKIKKSSQRIIGLLGIASGIVLIAVIALMLVLLSIQRSVKRIEGKMVKG